MSVTEETHDEIVAQFEARIEELETALRDVLGTAVILSRDYLAAFDGWAPTMTIQGWEKQTWIKAIEAKERAISILNRK